MNNNFWDDFISINNLVKIILIEIPETRDCDSLLIHYVWKHELKFHDEQDVLQLLKEKKLHNADSITRARRKLQEKREELRGNKWQSRHKLKYIVKEKIEQYSFAF